MQGFLIPSVKDAQASTPAPEGSLPPDLVQPPPAMFMCPLSYPRSPVVGNPDSSQEQ